MAILLSVTHTRERCLVMEVRGTVAGLLCFIWETGEGLPFLEGRVKRWWLVLGTFEKPWAVVSFILSHLELY